MAQGWISLNREVMSHWVWSCEFSAGQAWVDLLLYANHSPAKLMIKGQLVDVARGQQARSELTLSKSWKWSRSKVRRFLKNLENDGMINTKSGHLTTIITICNYDSFQCNDTSVDTQTIMLIMRTMKITPQFRLCLNEVSFHLVKIK